MKVKFITPYSNIPIEELRKKKIEELRIICNLTILSNFKVTISGVDYYFSHDETAQINFSSAKLAFMDGSATVISWTAYDSSGNIKRIQLTKEEFDLVFVAHLQHTISNIAKLRDILEPLVNEAQSQEQLDLIKW